jgi:hypothetical protein
MHDQIQQRAIRSLLLSTTFLASVAGTTLIATAVAQAGCDPITANGQTITCSGADTTGVANGGFNTTTVNVLDGATITPPATVPGLSLLANSHINLFGNGQVSTTGAFAYGALITGVNGTITLNADGAISTTGYVAHGAFIIGANGAITLNNAATVQTTGYIARGVQIRQRDYLERHRQGHHDE